MTGRVDCGCTGVGGARRLRDELPGVEVLERGAGMSFSERDRFWETGMMRLVRPIGERVKKRKRGGRGANVWIKYMRGG